MSVAKADAACCIPPRTPNCVAGDGGSIFLAGDEQFPADQPTHRSLCRTLRQPNGLRQFLIAHLNGSVPTSLFAGEPYIDKEAGRSAIMPDEVAHQHVYDVIV